MVMCAGFRSSPSREAIKPVAQIATISDKITLAARVDITCELAEPLRSFPPNPETGRQPQWDIATGKEVTP